MRSPAWALTRFQQADVALGPVINSESARIDQAQLMQRADAVRVAVENVNERNGGVGCVVGALARKCGHCKEASAAIDKHVQRAVAQPATGCVA